MYSIKEVTSVSLGGSDKSVVREWRVMGCIESLVVIGTKWPIVFLF